MLWSEVSCQGRGYESSTAKSGSPNPGKGKVVILPRFTVTWTCAVSVQGRGWHFTSPLHSVNNSLGCTVGKQQVHRAHILLASLRRYQAPILNSSWGISLFFFCIVYFIPGVQAGGLILISFTPP